MRTTFLLITAVAALLATEPSAASAFVRSLADAPAVQAAQERILAARRSAAAAGRLPDAMLSGGYARKSTTSERWPMYDLALEQPLPRWGERDAQRARAAADSASTQAELQEVLGETATEIAILIAEADAARARLVLIDDQLARATSLEATISARVAAGTATAAARLGVASRLAALRVEHAIVERQMLDAEQDARGRLGLQPAAALPPFAAPDHAAIAPERVPGVLAARAKAIEADAMFSEARASRYPETSVGLRYEREQQPGEPMDTVGLELRVSLPVWQRASGDLEDAAAARRRAARREIAGWEFRTRSLLGRAERAAAVAATARAAAEGTRARLDAEYEAVVRAAATQDGASLVSVLDVLDRRGEAEGRVIDAEADARQAEAGLWRLAPPDLSTIATERTQP